MTMHPLLDAMRRRFLPLLTLTLLAALLPMALGAGSPQVAAGAPAYPLQASGNGRYLVDQNGDPVPILGRTAWFVISLPVSDYQLFIEDSVSRGYNAIEMHVLDHDPRGNNPPFDGNGALPFLKRLDGTAWDGTLGGTGNAAPDFSTPNEAYWGYVDAFLNYCEAQGVLVFFFPAYVGYAGGDQGWMQEMTANGATKMNAYGAFLANRYKDQKNLVWMMGGDMGTFTASQLDAENGLFTGLKSVTPQQSTFFSAEWDSGMIATDQTTFGASMTLNGVYSWSGDVNALGRRAYARSPIEPAFLLEEPYDEEGPDGNGVNPSATQPVRRFQWWGWLSTIGGYISGNGYVWPFSDPNWRNHLDTQGSRDMGRLNAFIKSIEWYELVPSGLGGMKTLITAGGGAVSGDDYVAAAATSTGSLLVAYVPPAHSGSITVDLTAMSGSIQARWYDPTTGTYQAISGSPFANTGTRTFTTPGTNSAGDGDWVLVLESGPTLSSVTPTTGPTAGGTAVTLTGTNFQEGATVSFGGSAATGVTVVNSTTITATTPAHAAGAVNVAVTNPTGQSGTLISGFTYGSPTAPTLSSVAPPSGPTTGGTAVALTGTNFVTGATVSFGGSAATNVTVGNSTSLTATTPAHAAATVDVTVTNPDMQSGTLTNGFTYTAVGAPPPTLSSVAPPSGPTAGGTAATLTGTNFVTGATVSFGGSAATNVTVVNSTTITATTPAHAATTVNVMVTNPDSQSGTLPAGFTYTAATAINFMQVAAAVPQTSQSTVAVTYSAAQTAGNLNVVVVGWNDATRLVSSVADSKGNAYALAVGPTVHSAAGLSQAIYYARNIAAAAAGSNTVTVTFTGAAVYPDIRILEYSGLDPTAPLDGTAAGTGSSATSSTPALTTTNANDLLFAANTVSTSTAAPGTGFTSRVITNPDGDIAEDRLVTTTGSYSATASLNPAGQWVMQLVAFKAAAGGVTAPKIGIFRPATGTWYLDVKGDGRFDNCVLDKCIPWGGTGDTPVVGDWNGDGKTKIGIFRPSNGTWYLDVNGDGHFDNCVLDKCIPWGGTGDTPVVGDWNGDGKTKIGIFRPSTGTWYLDADGSGRLDCTVDKCIPWGGSTDIPVVGDWNGNARTKIGIFRPANGTWYLDVNGDGLFDNCVVDKCIPWGGLTDKPVIGKW